MKGVRDLGTEGLEAEGLRHLGAEGLGGHRDYGGAAKAQVLLT